MSTICEKPTRIYKFVPLKVKPETHYKVRMAAAQAGLPICDWIDRAATLALENAKEPDKQPQEQS